VSSRCISDKFFEPVMDLCRAVDGDAARLIEALDDRKVPRFLERNIETLREDGYLVLQNVPGPEVATREGMELMGEGFPLPTLLVQMTAIISDGGIRARARRTAKE